MSAIRTFNVEAGLPTLDEARRLVIEEIKQAKRAGARVLKVIHGYGSSGQGRGALRRAAKIVRAAEKGRGHQGLYRGRGLFHLQRHGAGPAGSGAGVARRPGLGRNQRGSHHPLAEVSGMLKALSIVGFLGMAGGVIAQFATGNLFSSSPLVIAVQVGAVLLLLWARLAFGWRSFHCGGQSDGGRLGDQRAVSAHPASDLHCIQCVQRGWGGRAMVLGERVAGRVGGGLRVAANLL